MENYAKGKIEMKSTNEFTEIVRLIEESRNRAFQKVNKELVLLYFTVGKTVSVRVSEGVWGDKTVDELSEYILNRFPGLSGFTRRGLYRMKQFYETYSIDSDCFKFWLEIQAEKENSQFVSTVLTQITWSNHMEILSGSKTPEENMFYLILTVKDKLKKLELRRQIKTASFERTMLAKKQNKIVSSLPTQFPTGVFKDPYIFEFLDLPEVHSEKDLEKALTQNLRKFIPEIGKGFTHMGNQLRLQVGNKDYYIKSV